MRLQVVSKPHHTLVTLLLCNAVALEVIFWAGRCWKLLDEMLANIGVCAGTAYLLGQTGRSSDCCSAECHSCTLLW